MEFAHFGRGESLAWSQPKMSERTFELREGKALVAALVWHGPFGSLATGTSALGSWTLKRAGFLRPRVNIRAVEPPDQVAQFEAGWAGGGQLIFNDGHGYYWRQRSFWQNEWAFEDERGELVAQFRSDRFILKRSVQLTIDSVPRVGRDLSLLAILGLYLMILSNDDAVANMSIIAA